VYGGVNVTGALLGSVEMLAIDGHVWQTLPTAMFKADNMFASVAATKHEFIDTLSIIPINERAFVYIGI
jgi:hypothetical protein